jgi:AcrR family transcriptional regulator
MTGLRERQKAGRREDILDAASLLFRRDGFAETSIEEIAARAGLSAGTVYNYFGAKGDLLLALVALDGEEVRSAGAALRIRSPRSTPCSRVMSIIPSCISTSGCGAR